MFNLDERLTNGLHGIVDGEPDSTPPTEKLLELGRRGRRRRSGVAVSATLAVLALGAIGTATLVQPSTPTRPAVGAEATASQVASPQVELVSAVTASENISYRIKASITARKTAGKFEVAGRPYTTEGAFDPATDTGYLRSEGHEERLIDGVRFVRSPGGTDGQFVQDGSARFDRLAYDAQVLDGALSGSADPESLFDVLRQADAKITKTGAGTYHFVAASRDDDAIQSSTTTFVGDITVGADQRVATVTYEWATRGRTKRAPQSDFAKNIRVTLELSDYGAPVKVERPTNVVVLK
ncbi:hypothetical protein [Micromonospora inositola]|uniref:Uncharacterized protein n=1 Tax=Micromonospora inositola TaxID=47865 RepID=A0A1C5HQ11_9ACTN|nr:hypothetical protein [Micromonospora inositola]SCG48082.1 hypothetical protein GA0070613_1648 [Micromonospora inositola]